MYFLDSFMSFLYYQAPFHSGFLWAGRGMQLCFCKFAEEWQEYNDRSASSYLLAVITMVVFALKLGPEITSRSWNHRINSSKKPLVASIFAQSAQLVINRQEATCDIENRKTKRRERLVKYLTCVCWQFGHRLSQRVVVCFLESTHSWTQGFVFFKGHG